MFDLVETNITQEDKKSLINDINEYFDTGNWCYFVPKFQTWPTLFQRNEAHWKKLRDSFVEHCCNKIGTESFVSLKCWAYKNVPFAPGEGDWHCHFEEDIVTVSGLFYLMLPTNDMVTEYIDKNTNQAAKFPSKENCWTVYNGNLMHRPSVWNHLEMKQSRIVIAADINFRYGSVAESGLLQQS